MSLKSRTVEAPTDSSVENDEIWRAVYTCAERIRALNVLKDAYRYEPELTKKLNKQLGILTLRADRFLRQLS